MATTPCPPRVSDYLEAVDHGLSQGLSLDDVDESIIQPLPLTTDQQAALWLYAWNRLPDSSRSATVGAMLAMAFVAGG